jgi:crotonobetainyl-CoA:carnitine CoA-transferase CaiB-like acyl-CoA transferase
VSDPEQYGLNALYRLYKTGDGWIFLAATNDKERAALEATLGLQLPDGDDARIAALTEAFTGRKADELEHELTQAGVGCATVFPDGHPAFIATDDVMLETGLAADIEHPLFGTIRRHGLPALLSETPGRIAPGCLRGEHTDAILRELGYNEEQIAELEAKKVVFGPD